MDFITDNFWTLLITSGLAVLSYLLTRFLLNRFLLGFLRRTRPAWGQLVGRTPLIDLLALLAPLLVVATGAQSLVTEYWLTNIIRVIANILIIIDIALILNAMINIGLARYESTVISKRVPLRGLAQMLKVVLFVLAGIIVTSVFLQIPAAITFGALAALLAAAGFILKDPILGFIAGIQLAGNEMVAIGDWIQMPKYNADGAVREITMTTVKVQNWDNSTTMIPTYTMVSDSFTNWRSMTASGGRRIKRAFLIDLHTVAPCTPEQLTQLAASGLYAADSAPLANHAGALTNLTLLRAYLLGYLQTHPAINQQMTLIVRQLEPSDSGQPLEVYAFTQDTAWVTYEGVQSAIFEHIYGVLPSFGLKIYQRQRAGNYMDAPGAP